jgi:uncharacterized protein (UPF0261 family)
VNAPIRQDETRGSLDERLLAIENSLFNRWENWFGKHPGAVIGIVIVTICSGAWVVHTWQVDRITKEYESRITWLKEQNIENIKAVKEKCNIEKERIGNKLEQCKSSNITSKGTGREKAAPVL